MADCDRLCYARENDNPTRKAINFNGGWKTWTPFYFLQISAPFVFPFCHFLEEKAITLQHSLQLISNKTEKKVTNMSAKVLEDVRSDFFTFRSFAMPCRVSRLLNQKLQFQIQSFIQRVARDRTQETHGKVKQTKLESVAWKVIEFLNYTHFYTPFSLINNLTTFEKRQRLKIVPKSCFNYRSNSWVVNCAIFHVPVCRFVKTSVWFWLLLTLKQRFFLLPVIAYC